MKSTTFTQVRMINPINLEPAMHVMDLISLKIVMKQLALDVNLISVVICHLNAPGNFTPTHTLAIIIFTKVTPWTDMK